MSSDDCNFLNDWLRPTWVDQDRLAYLACNGNDFQNQNSIAIYGKEQMNSESEDAQYSEMIGNLRQSLKALALEIRPKVYEYGFLKK